VPYEAGTLAVVAYRGGEKWASDAVKTAGAPAILQARPDRREIAADGRDLSFVTVRVVDGDGQLVPRANNRVRFSIRGSGEIVATDNGDPTSFVPFQSFEREAFNGFLLAIVRAKKGETGRIVLTATSEGLRAGEAFITSIGGR
jgi:beta-galactosidase